MSDKQARVSALGEAFERLSAVYQGDEPRLRSSFDKLGDEAVDPRKLLCYSQYQTENHKEHNNLLSDSKMQLVCQPFETDREMDWTYVWSMTEERKRQVPTAYLYFGHPDLLDYFSVMCCANGCAGGNTLEEAIVQGACEIIERDAVGIWWYNRVQRRAIDLNSLKHPFIEINRKHLLEHFNRKVWCLDVTTDVGVSVVVAVSTRNGDLSDCPVMGFGAHLDPQVAILRALTEVNQFLPGLVEKPDGSISYGYDDRDTMDWFENANLETDPYLKPVSDAAAVSVKEMQNLATDDLRSDILVCCDQLKKIGLEMLVADLTRPDIGFPVCKVMAPGLCHMWRRLGSPRLYNVPVELGLLSEPRKEADLNPRSVFF
jgi:ribosomal protein S12 methylthiotransferase accessory factor